MFSCLGGTERTAQQLKARILDVHDLDWNSKSAVYQLCAVGKLLRLSVSQFSHL